MGYLCITVLSLFVSFLYVTVVCIITRVVCIALLAGVGSCYLRSKALLIGLNERK